MRSYFYWAVLLTSLTASGAQVIWSEDFEGASLGATSGNNQTLAGTVVQTANTASGIIVDASTDSGAAASFTYASGKFIRLSTGANAWTALRSSSGPIFFTQTSPTQTYTLSFDVYIPSTLSTAVGDIRPKFTLNGTAAADLTDASMAVRTAGQYHIEYSGLISDFLNTDVNAARPFIGIDQGGTALSDYLYVDNIYFEIGTSAATPETSPIDPAWFADLKSGRVESSPLVQWQHFGPGMSGYIDMFWINNGDPNAMYDSLDMGNSQVTLNGGKFWRSMRDSDGCGYHPDYFVAMDFSFTDPDFGLAVRRNVKTNRGELFQSTDRGASWTFLCEPIPGSDKRHNVIAVDPSNDNNWYIGAGGGAFIKDAHYTKSGITNTSPWKTYMSEGFIMYSKDRGTNWTQVSSPFPTDSSFSRIIVDPRDSNKVYASCQHGVYRSSDGGLSWSKVPGNGLPYNQPRYMDSYFDPEANGGAGEFLLYIVEITHYDPVGSEIVTSGGVYRTADGGDYWENLTGDLAIDFTQISRFGWDYHNRFYRAVAFWMETTASDISNNYNLPASTFSQFHQIAVDPTQKDRVYLVHNFKHDYAFPPGNIWMTENGGTNWFAAAREGPYWINGLDDDYWNSRAVQPLGMNTTMAHVDRDHRLYDAITVGPRFIKVNQLGHVYTAFAQQVMRSTDNGATWIQVDDDETSPGSGHWVGRGNSNLPGESICLQTGTPGTYLWGSGEHGLWRNTHDGDLVYPGAIAVKQLTGQSIDKDDPTSIATIAVDPNDTNKIYTLQFRQDKRNHLRHSSDGGETWMTLSQPLPDIDIRSRSLMVDHQNSDILYFTIPYSIWQPYGGAGKYRGNGSADMEVYGVYKSIDGGVTWTNPNSGLPSGSSVWKLFMDPVDSRIIYAALAYTHTGTSGGLYKTDDGAANWFPMTVPAGVTCVNDVMVHKTTGDLYIACGRREGDGSTGGAYVSRDGGETWVLIFDFPNVRGVNVCAANDQVIAVIAGEDDDVNDLNPGAYVTVDGGHNWHKINRRHGQPEKIRELQVDPYDETILWCCLSGTGFWKADISGLTTGVAKPFFWDWMEEHGLADRTGNADGDVMSNIEEYIADTDPNNMQEYFAGEPVAGGVGVQFRSVLSRNYSVEKTDNLTGDWFVWTNGVAGTGSLVELTDPEGTSNVFYRVKVQMN
ncbi:WD40/YVTN/BNR-like repeat-containing protein [Pontiella agarivorans]|uniref:Sortilin N-terminal domain-containing protein n=1 Tax=Pontiella agarivorans TaxID=3038953 RepID=A0ABU5MTK0_9BACT|nr:hypothetical protein [Pontiella agarivorans]MDZ8117550.1 hypothetical protein [Pontiella agarivorans]